MLRFLNLALRQPLRNDLADMSDVGQTRIDGYALLFRQDHLGAFQLPQPKRPTSESPRCPKCYASMTLARTTPGSPGFEIRSLECPECKQSIVHRVATTPLA